MRRGLNKKAQEGMSAPALGAIILVVIVVVLLILVLSGVMNPILEKLNLLPGSGIAGIVQACQTYVPISSTADWCSFKDIEIDGRDQYVNCEDSRVQASIESESKNALDCKTGDDKKLELTQCALLIKQSKSKPVVNGIECINKDFLCTSGDDNNPLSLKGKLPNSDGKCDSGYRIIEGYNSKSPTEKCCVIV